MLAATTEGGYPYNDGTQLAWHKHHIVVKEYHGVSTILVYMVYTRIRMSTCHQPNMLGTYLLGSIEYRMSQISKSKLA